jgi:DNA-binding response OmpR family regulator
MKVLLVEDNERLRRSVKRVLMSVGVDVAETDAATPVPDLLGRDEIDVVVLDLELPDRDGLELLDELRADGHATAVLAVSVRDTPQDRVTALDRGADDYLSKPFAIEELLARLHALHRRPRQLLGPSLRLGNVVLDPAGRTVSVHDRPIAMTRHHLAVLECLMRQPAALIPQRRLMAGVYGAEAVAPNALQRHVSELRRRLARAGATITIVSSPRRGYRIERSAPRDAGEPRSAAAAAQRGR